MNARDYRRLVICADCGKQERTAARLSRQRCLSCAAKFRVREYPNARFRAMPDAWKERARLLAARGYGPTEVHGHLADEGIIVARPTVRDWLYTTPPRLSEVRDVRHGGS